VKLRCLAPGKVNLCLYVGAPRADGRHPLVSVVQAVSLADELTLEPAAAGGDADEVVCPGVEGENLAATALAAFREATGWDAPPQRLTIAKRVPVAAGMGGGSSDAAAALRLAAHAAGDVADDLLLALAARLGGDVPALLDPGRTLMLDSGERIRRLPAAPPFALLILPSRDALSTAAVYRRYDERGPERRDEDLAALERHEAWPIGNDLQDAARDLCPSIDAALATVRDTGAEHVLVSGSGPTVFGIYPTRRAAEAAARKTGGIAAEPVEPHFGEVTPA
jgi:4-diphosphocytidyl-2-C-methyl-D-erythritol kinase